MVPPPFLRKLSLGLAMASAISILLSIAISQILLALALGVLLLSGLPLRWPPRASILLGLFLGWTLVSLAFSPDPGHGLPQVRKMLVFVMLLIVYSSVRTVAEAKWLVMAWIAVGTVTAGRGLAQFVQDVARAKAAHTDFYTFYIGDRIRGFMSHWMTFSGQELFVLLLTMAFLLFGPRVKQRAWLWVPCAAVVGLALVLSDTRSIWIASVCAGFYLLWSWNRWSAAAMPVLLAVGLVVAPAAIQERAWSIVHPKKQTDSNEHRIACWRTGWAMIQAHPVLGVGPEEIAKQEVFNAYKPTDMVLPEGYYKHLHNIYIHYAAERGIPATLFLTAALGVALWDFRKGLRGLSPGRSERRFLLQGAMACLIGTMVSGVFELNLGDTEVLTMFLVILCVGYVALEAPQAPVDILGPQTNAFSHTIAPWDGRQVQ